MKLRRKNRRRAIAILGMIATGGAGIMAIAFGNPTNIAQTQPDHADARLRTRHYRRPLAEAQRIIEKTIPTLKTYGRRWRLVATSRHGDSIIIQAAVPVLVFTDDLTVTLREQDRQAVVDVRSASRVGKGDFGENARHVRQLLRMLDDKLNEH